MLVASTRAEISSGVVFRKLEDTIISDSAWKVVLDFNLVEIIDELLPLKSKCQELNYIVLHGGFSEDMTYEYTRIKTGLDQYETDLMDLFKLLPNSKIYRRGLIDGGGYVLKWLFGVPTSEDFQHMNDKVDELRLMDGVLVNSREHQLTLMKDINAKVVNNTKAVYEVMLKVTNVYNRTAMVVNRFINQSTREYQSLIKQLDVTTKLHQLGQTIDEAKLRIVEFRQALEIVNTGKISSKLLAPHDFIKILYTIEKLVPIHLKLVIPVNEEDIFLYYNMCKAQALATKSGLRLIVTVPLSSDDRKFESYKIEVVPLYQASVKHWVKWNMNYDYLLISKDRQYYVALDKDVFSQCRYSYLYMCPNSIHVFHHTVNDCSYVLFMGTDLAIASCQRVLTDSVISPYWLQNNNDWIYSVSEPYNIVLNCLKEAFEGESTSYVKDNFELTINGSGRIKEVSSCDIFGSNGRLFSRISGNLFYKRNISQLHIPKLKSMIRNDEMDLMENDVNLTFETLNEIKHNLADKHVQIELETLIKAVKDKNVMYVYSLKSYYPVILVISFVISMILVGVYLCHRRNQMWCKTSKTSQEPQPLTVRAEPGSALSDIIEEASFVRITSPSP